MKTEYLKAYASSLCDEYGAKIKFKNKSIFMKFIAFFLDLFNIMDKKTFMEYSTTIGRTMYLSFELGDFEDVSYYGQISTIAHEITHVSQYNHEGCKFFFKYLFSLKWRAIYEMYAWGVSMEMHYFLTKRVLSPQDLANKLIKYKCTSEQVRQVAIFLENVSTFLGKRVVFKPSKSAIYWLKNHSDILWQVNG